MSVHLEGQVRDVDQLVVSQGEQVEEAELGESSRLDLFHSVTVDHELLQRGQSVKGLLGSQNTRQDKMFVPKKNWGDCMSVMPLSAIM